MVYNDDEQYVNDGCMHEPYHGRWNGFQIMFKPQLGGLYHLNVLKNIRDISNGCTSVTVEKLYSHVG